MEAAKAPPHCIDAISLNIIIPFNPPNKFSIKFR